jgi:hypothetical protein
MNEGSVQREADTKCWDSAFRLFLSGVVILLHEALVQFSSARCFNVKKGVYKGSCREKGGLSVRHGFNESVHGSTHEQKMGLCVMYDRLKESPDTASNPP